MAKILDTHLAGLYDVSVGRLNEAVKRNRSRFPPDFMFQLTTDEWSDLKSQSAISSSGWGGRPSQSRWARRLSASSDKE